MMPSPKRPAMRAVLPRPRLTVVGNNSYPSVPGMIRAGEVVRKLIPVARPRTEARQSPGVRSAFAALRKGTPLVPSTGRSEERRDGKGGAGRVELGGRR